MKRVLIAGAGIIGLATALDLALNGIEVTVLERGSAMREASWAAAGMLAAHDPENPPLLAALSRFSLSLYPEFLRRIEDLSGLRVPLRTSRTLQICRPEHTPADAHLLSRAEAHERVPGLHPGIEGNFLWLEEASLDPRDLCRALPVAVRAAGARIVENHALGWIDTTGGLVTAHPSSPAAPSFSADALVICCGAWSQQKEWVRAGGGCLNTGLGMPRKGQMIAVRMPADALPLRTVLRSADVYLVPRMNASDPSATDATRIIIGATVEDAGFDRSVQPCATAWLLEQAAALWPPLRHAQVEEEWTGIRPATLDGLPLIGPVVSERLPDASDAGHVWVATGHYRNGILLAPGTARVVSSSLTADKTIAPGLDLEPFRPSRSVSRSPEHPSTNTEMSARQQTDQVLG